MLKFPLKTAATITFADRGENEYGMEIEGKKTDRTTSVGDLMEIKESVGNCDFYPLVVRTAAGAESAPAGVLVMRGFALKEGDKLMHEIETMKQQGLVDTKSLSYGTVRNKHARWNNVISWRRQSPDIANGKGTICSFEDWEAFHELHDRLHEVLKQPKTQKLVGELNYYYDVASCGIGFHGDKERDLVAGLSLGKATAEQTLKFVPYLHGTCLHEPIEINLNHGDVYIMSHKAIGSDCAKKNIITWRHARGAPSCKYSVVNPKHLPPGSGPARAVGPAATSSGQKRKAVCD